MPVITGSTIFLIAKGIGVFAKSAALKAAAVKYGAYLISAKGIAVAAGTAATVATVAGAVAVVNDATINTVKGFSKMKDGIVDGSVSDFLEGVVLVGRGYRSATDLMDDFYDYLVDAVPDSVARDIIAKGAKEMESLVRCEIEDSVVDLIAEVEIFLKKHNTDYNSYGHKIDSIYRQRLTDVNIANYGCLLGQAGKAYDDIIHYNMSVGLNGDNSEYDHYLAFCAAGWIKENVRLDFISGKTQTELAGDITNNILRYLDANRDKRLISDGFTTDAGKYDENVSLLYRHYFTDQVYDYDRLLAQAGKAYNDLCLYNVRMKKWADRNKYDHTGVFYIACWIKENTGYSFIGDKTANRIAADITNKIFEFIRHN